MMSKSERFVDGQPSGTDRITTAFASVVGKRKAALMPYFTLGFPNRYTSLDIIERIASYSDLLELGVPFSDPIADGPSIQRSTQLSLQNGTTTSACLQMLQELRRRGVETPVMLMGYYNPILAYGESAYVRDAAAAGVDGFIVPDLPLEESEPFERLASASGLALIHFLAPSSSPIRIKQVVERAQGFIYVVSLTGTTGARSQLSGHLQAFVASVRGQTQLPLAVGFGISTPAQASSVGDMADGVIVGSALIDAVAGATDKPGAALEFVRSLRQGLEFNGILPSGGVSVKSSVE
jgi:tryptophan synthase alpha chain